MKPEDDVFSINEKEVMDYYGFVGGVGKLIMKSKLLVKKEGLSPNLIKRDYRAKDTLTNFTSLVDDFAKGKVNHLLIITSTNHVQRSMLIGSIIAGSRGIKVTSLSIPCKEDCEIESAQKKYMDCLRAIAWVITRQDIKEIIPTNIITSFTN